MSDLALVQDSQRRLFEKCATLRNDAQFQPYMEAIQQSFPDTPEMVTDTTLLMMDNLREWIERMDEATRAVNVGNFINYGFELMAAVMPNLLAHEFVSVQPMTRRVGEIFYLNYRYGTTKGNITANDTLFGVFQSGQGGEQWYTSETVYQEPVDIGDGMTVHFTHTAGMIPINATGTNNFSLTDGTETFTPNAVVPTTLDGSAGGTGTINYTTGEVDVTFNAAPVLGRAITMTYKINFETNPDNIPEVDLSVYSDAITAQNRKLRAHYTLDAAYDLQQAFGRSAEADLSAALASAIRAEIDGEIFYDLYNGAFDTMPTWTRNMPTGVSWRDHKFAIIDAIVAASNQIFIQTRRVAGNFVVAGVNVCTIIEALEGRFKRTAQRPLPGPHVIGYLDNFPIIKNPYYGVNTFLVGYRGDLWLDTGYVYAPYMPLYTTPSITLSDFTTRKGMGTRYAKRMVNSRMYVRGSVTGSVIPTPA